MKTPRVGSTAKECTEVRTPERARPAGADPPSDEGGDREGRGGQEADIAAIEERRVEGETRVLQQRIEVAAVDRDREQPIERVRCPDDEGQGAEAEQALNCQ